MTDVRPYLDNQNNNPFQVNFNLPQNKIGVYSKEKSPTPPFLLMINYFLWGSSLIP